LFDAKWQDPYESSKIIAKYLLGEHKPIHTKTINGKSTLSDSDLRRLECGQNICLSARFLYFYILVAEGGFVFLPFEYFLPGDFGDHVIVINSADIALKADDWYYRVYFHHTGYPGGASWTKAWEVHRKNPTMVKFIYSNI